MTSRSSGVELIFNYAPLGVPSAEAALLITTAVVGPLVTDCETAINRLRPLVADVRDKPKLVELAFAEDE